MKLYEKINKACSHGNYPIVSNGEKYGIISPHKDHTGNWRDSAIWRTLEDAIKSIGLADGDNKSGWNDLELNGYKIIGFYHPEFEPYEVGDKVKVRADLELCLTKREWLANSKKFRDTAGKIGKVQDITHGGYHIFFDDINDWYNYPHNQLETFFEEEEKTIELTLEEIAEKFGTNVKNIKIKK
jgi:hypothetical protein